MHLKLVSFRNMRQAVFLRRIAQLRREVSGCGWSDCLSAVDAAVRAENEGCFSESWRSPSRGCRKTLLELIASGHEGHLSAEQAEGHYASLVANVPQGNFSQSQLDSEELDFALYARNEAYPDERDSLSADLRNFRSKRADAQTSAGKHDANMQYAREAIDHLRALAAKDLQVALAIVDEARQQHLGQ